MDFFAQQDRARASTRRMLVLYVLSLLGVIITLNIVAAAVWGAAGNRHASRREAVYDEMGQLVGVNTIDDASHPPFAINVPLHLITTAAVLAVVGIATLIKQAEIGGDGANVAELLGGHAIAAVPTDLGERRLLNVVEEMSLASGVPTPRVYILNAEKGINAFAAGTRADRAVVCVTRGALDTLSRDQLQGVIAHEFSHILNGDMRLNLRLIALNFGIMAIGYLGLQVLRFTPSNSSSRRDDKNNGAAAILVFAIAMVVLGYVGTLFGKMLQAAVSRQREYLADASAVQFTRNPDGIAGALKRIGGYGSELQSTSAGEASHLFFADGVSGFLNTVFATHPPLAARIKAIEPSFDGTMTPADAPVDFGDNSNAVAQAFLPVSGGTSARNLSDVVRTQAGMPVPLQTAPDQTATLVTAIPDALRNAAREPYDARAIALSLLLDRDPIVRERQLAMIAQLDPAAAKLAADHSIAVESSGAAARLPILNLTLPALAQLSSSQQVQFRGLCQALAEADQVLSPFEVSLFKVIDNALQGTADGGVKFASVNAISEPAGVILSTLAMAGGAAQAEAAFAAGVARLQLAKPPTLAVDYNAAAYSRALSIVRQATSAVRRRLVDAAAYTVTFDDTVRIEELELLRAACAAFDVPLPPLAASSTMSS